MSPRSEEVLEQIQDSGYDLPARRVITGMSMIQFSVLAAIALSLVPPGTRVEARPGAPTHVSVTGQGVRLSIAVPKGKYPRNALVQVTVTLQNISGHPIALGPACAGPSPGVAVFTRDGRKVYPPAVVGPIHPTPGCFPPTMSHAVLRPGGVRVRYPYAILASTNVAGTAVFNTSRAAGISSWPQVQTPFVSEVLSPAMGPRITYTVSPQFVVTMHPMGGEQGPLHFTYGIACGSPAGIGTIRDSGDRWHTTAGTRIVIPLLPGCTRMVELEFVGGWLNHPVTRLRYRHYQVP